MREKLAILIAFGTGLVVLLFSILFAIRQNPATLTPPRINPETPPSIMLSAPPAHLNPESIETGRMLYREQTCMRCHSIGGQGNPRNPLDNVGLKHTAEVMREWIIGADTLETMLSERTFRKKQPYKKLSDDDIDALVIYMQSLIPESDPATRTEPAAVPVGD